MKKVSMKLHIILFAPPYLNFVTLFYNLLLLQLVEKRRGLNWEPALTQYLWGWGQREFKNHSHSSKESHWTLGSAQRNLTLILVAILLGHYVTAFSSKCLPEEVETATSRPESPFLFYRSKLEGCLIKKERCCCYTLQQF